MSASDPRPASDVSTGVGLAGLAGLLVWIVVCREWATIADAFALPGPRAPLSGRYAALAALLASGVPMVLWSLWVGNSRGELVAVAAADGAATPFVKLGDSISLAPVVANGTLYVLDDSGRISAFR